MAREYPEQSYYPSARVRLIVRFEEYDDQAGTPQPPNAPPQVRRGTRKQQEPEKLRVVTEASGALRLAGPEDDANQQGGPQAQTASTDGYTHVIDGIIPMGASLARNGIRVADTLNLTLNYRDLPIDPRVARSVAVEYFLGCVSADDYERGIRGDTRSQGVAEHANIPYNVIPDTWTDAAGRERSNLRFQGWVDEWENEWSDDDNVVLSLTCTDNTRLLLEQDHPSRMAVAVDVPIDQAIAQYLASFPQFRGLGVEYRPRGTGVEVPTLKKVLNVQAYPPGVGPPASKPDGAGKMKVWDYLTDVVTSLGLSIRMISTTVIIQRPRTLYANKFAARDDDPFTGRILPNGRSIDRRLFVYGENIRTMRATRGLTKYAPANVEIRSYNPARKKTLVVRYPAFVGQAGSTAKTQKTLQPGESVDQKYIVKTIDGIGDEATLRVIAQSTYEGMQRRELEFNVRTKNLASLGGGNDDPDLLDIDTGDPIDIEVKTNQNPDADVSTTQTLDEAIRTRPAQFLRELGFPAEFANAYAKAVNNIGFPTTFRVRDVQFDWDAQAEGVSIDVNVMNYIEVRAGAELPDGEEIQPAGAQGTPVRVNVRDDY